MTDLYLLAADRTCSAQSLVDGAYRGPTKERAAEFLRANAFAGPNDRLMQGELYAVPGLSPGPRLEAGQVGRAVARANYLTRNQRSEPAAAEFNANFHWLYDMLGSEESKQVAKTAENSFDYFEKRTDKIVKLFEEYERNYRFTAQTGANFVKNSASNTARRFIERDLQGQLTGVSRKLFLESPQKVRLHDQLGISHKSIKNHVKLGTNPKDLDNIALAAGKAKKLAGQLKKGALFIKIASFGGETYGAFKQGGWNAAGRKGAEEGFKLGASAAGGAAAGWALGAGLAFFGVATGGLGVVVIVVGGSVIAGMGSEVAAEAVWDEWGNGLYTVAEDKMGLLVKSVMD